MNVMVMRQALHQLLLPATARGMALFLGGFGLLNLAGDLAAPGLDANIWWLDVRPLPTMLGTALLAGGSALLLAFGVRPNAGRWRGRATAALVAMLLIVALANAVTFYGLLARRQIAAKLPVPLSVLVAAGLAMILTMVARGSRPMRRRESAMAVTVAGLCAVGFPLAQMFFFGTTDYRRSADAIVVFGARAYADGRPSDALADRVRTACNLYAQGLAPRLIFSGGPADGDAHEADAMRRMALTLGVPDEAILLDRGGVNTDATVANTSALCDRLGLGRVLAVSHFYHLPRVKMTYQRCGRQIYTVPARQRYVLTKMPYLMAREVPALWVYYLRALAGQRRG